MNNNYHLSNKGRATSSCIAALFSLILFLNVSRGFAQLTGTKNIPGDYATLDLAITDLNTQGVGAGGVILNVIAGNPQSAPVGGYQINPNGTAANPISIQGNGNTVIASNALVAGSLNDAIFKLVGADYTTIAGFSIQENAANTTTAAATNNMTEWGVALVYASTTDGATNNTITTNTITLNRSYTNSFGIYSNVRHSLAAPTTTADITAASGANSNNKVYANTISNVNMGITFVGSGTAANQDNGNDIGGASAATGNVITNWGGAAPATTYPSNSGTSYGIFVNHQKGENVSYNTLTSAAVSGTAVTFRGIFKDYTVAAPTGTFLSSVTNNTVTLTSGFTSGTFECIRSQGMGSLSTATITISNNTILNSVISGVASSSALVCIVNSSAPGVLNLTNNIIRGNTSTATTGGFTGISNTGAVTGQVNITNNQVGNASGNAITFSAATSGAVTGIANSGTSAAASVTISGNNIQGIVHSVAGTSAHTYINNTAADASVTISGNTFTNLNVNTTGNATFISHSYTIPAGGTQLINGNSVVTAFNKGGSGGTVTFMTSGGSSVSNTASIIHTNNNFSSVTVTGTTVLNGISNTDGLTTQATPRTVTGNVFSNWTAGTGAITAISYGYFGGINNWSGNLVSNLSGQGIVTGMNLGSSGNNATAITVSTNTITALSSTGTGGAVTGIASSNISSQINITNNLINTLSSTGASSAVTGVNITNAFNTSVSQNMINTLSGSGATSPAANGINVSAGTTINLYKNKIYDITENGAISTSSPAVNGIVLFGGTTVNVYNNLVGDLRAPSANLIDAVRGISITSTGASSTYNLYYNTVNVKASSSGTNFGTTCLFHAGSATATTANLVLRNNVFVNNSTPNGTGLAVAYRISNTNLANYATTSNNNLFFAGSPSATKLIFTDGTNSDQTLAAFQTRVAPADAASVTENVNFLSLIGSNPGFLHVDNSIPTVIESGAVNIGGITDDYDADIRQGNPGYTGTGSAPDIGADEFAGTNPNACTGAPTSGTITGPAVTPVCGLTVNTLTLTGASSGIGFTYQWQSSTTPGGPYINLGSGNLTQTVSPNVTTYYIVNVTCTGSGSVSPTPEFTLAVNTAPPVSVTPISATYCSPGTGVSLTASGASTYTWAPAAGLSATTGTNVTATPTVATVYTVTGTDANSCTGTASTTISIAPALTLANVTASPSSVCSGASSTLTVAAYPVANTYCASTHSSGCGSNDEIQNVLLSTLSNTTACAASAYTYYNGGGTQTTTLTAGSTYTLSVKLGTDANQYVGAWIDYNQDGTLATTEFLGASGNAGSGGTANLTFVVPAGAYNGITRLRVIGGNDVAVLNTNACGASSSNFGETEDYDLTIISGASNSTYTYTWSPGTFLSSATGSPVTASSVTATTTYTATATSVAGCAASGTVTLTAGSPLTSSVNITPNDTVCANTTFTLSSSPSGGGAPYTYAWSGPNSFTATTQNPSLTAIMADAGVYTVTVTDNCGANSVNTITLTVNPAPSVTTTPNAGLICNPGGASVSLVASGANTYSWSPSAGLSATNVASVSASPTATTVYTVTGTDAVGCSSTSTASITVSSAVAIASISANPAAVCSGGSSTLTVSGYPVSNSYCASTHSSGCGMGDEIQQVTLNTLTYTSTCSGTAYSYFNGGGAQTTTLTAGSTYTLSAKFGTDGSQYFGAWIDYNQDGTLAAGEFLGASANAGASGTTSITFTVPAGAFSGVTRLRIVGGNDSPVTSAQACGASSSVFGETEDYDVRISGGATNSGLTYSWAPGTFLAATTGSSVTASSVTATVNYTATVMSAAGCSASDTVTLVAGSQLSSTASVTPSSTVCAGITFTLVSTPAGGGAPYTYAWSGPNSFTATVQNPTIVASLAAAGDYTITVTDNCGATSTNTVNVAVNPQPSLTLTPTSGVICNPGGSPVSLSASGANTYTWSPAAGLSATNVANVSANPTVTTIYTVTGTDAIGCSTIASAAITVAASLSMTSITASPANLCSGGSSTLTAVASASNSYCTGAYTTGTSSSDYITNVTLGTINNSTGASAAPYNTYYSAQNTNLTAGSSYTITGTINNGGTEDVAVWIDYDQDGLFSASEKLGEQAGLSYAISFTVPATAYNGVTRMRVRNVYNTTGIQPCNQYTYGEIEDYNVTISGGSTGITYAWSPGTFLGSTTGSMVTASSVTATTTYTAIATSAAGCSVTGTVTVSADPLTGVSLAVTPSATVCQGTSITISSTIAGGGAPYSYTWSPGGQSTANITVTPTVSTTYTLDVMDNCGATTSNTIAITVNPLPVVSVTPTATLYCIPGATPTLTANGANTYSWTPANGLSATSGSVVAASPTVTTSYVVTGIDANGCMNTAGVSITAAPAVTGYTASVSATPICAGDTIDLSASANTYSVTIMSEDFNSGAPSWTRINNSTAGTSTLAAAWTDRPNGYQYAGGTAYHSNDNSQFVQSNSDAQGSGGTTRTILQSPSFSTTGLSNLSLKFYQFYRHLGSDSAIVELSTNATSWTKIAGYVATTGSEANFSATNVAIPAAFNNQAAVYVRFRYVGSYAWYWSIDNVAVTGSSSSFTYNWTSAPAGFTSTAQNPTDLTPTVTTTYSVDISNIYGCSATAVTSVTVNPLPVVNLGNDTTLCGGTLNLNAGNAGSTYLWNDASTAQTLTATATGTYYVTVTTAPGCVASDTVDVVINPAVTLNLGPDTTRCGGTVTLDAGNPGATYLWSNSAATQTITVANTGTYFVTVTNAQGCSKTDTVQVTVNPVPVVDLGNDTMICGGNVVLDAGNAGATYLWSDASNAQTLMVTNSGTYFVDVTNAQGCTSRDTVNITLNPAVSVNLGNDTAICAGNSLILDAQNPGATYMWSDNSTGSVLVVNTPGTYSVTVSYTTGCSASDTILVSDGTPAVSLALGTHSVCLNASPVTLSGGSPASGTYSGAGVTGSTFSPSVAGTGTTTITYNYTDAASGCSNSASDVMTVVAAPSVTLSLPLDSICLNASAIALTGGSPASGTYSGSGVSGGNFDPSVAGAGTVVITYVYTDGTTGCSASAADNIVVKSCVDVKEYNAAEIVQVYPNPTSGNFTIELGNASDDVKATLYSVEGKVIFSSELTGKTHFTYDIMKLDDGMYYLELKSAQGNKVVKLVKQF